MRSTTVGPGVSPVSAWPIRQRGQRPVESFAGRSVPQFGHRFAAAAIGRLRGHGVIRGKAGHQTGAWTQQASRRAHCRKNAGLRHQVGPPITFAECVFLRRRRTSKPTIGPDRRFLSVCYPKAKVRGAWWNGSGKIVDVRHKKMFREQVGSERDRRSVPRSTIYSAMTPSSLR